MTDPNTDPTNLPQAPGFPYFTVAVAGGILFVFRGLMWLATRKENPLEAPTQVVVAGSTEIERT